MLGALAVIALVVGSVSVTSVLTEDQRLAAEDGRAPVVEVQTIQDVDAGQSGN